MNYEKILRALLSKAYKLDTEKLNELFALTEEADFTTALLDTDKNRITALSTPKAGTTFQDGYKKAKGEVLAQFETDLKSKFGVEADVTGLELVELVLETKGKSGGKGTLTDDDVKKHPAYQTLEASIKKQLTDKETEWKTKYETFEGQVKKDEVLAKVKERAFKTLDKLNPVLSANAEVAQNIKDLFGNAFKNYDYELQGDRIVILDKDGKVVDDGHGNSLDFESLAKSTASKYFEFQNNNGGGNSGNNNDNGGGGAGGAGSYPAGIKKPGNIEELTAILENDAVKTEDKQIVLDTWDAENS